MTSGIGIDKPSWPAGAALELGRRCVSSKTHDVWEVIGGTMSLNTVELVCESAPNRYWIGTYQDYMSEFTIGVSPA